MARGEIRTISFVSLGCPKNLVDSEKMLALLAEDGLVPVAPTDGDGVTPADAVVVNTCGFLEASKEESLRVLTEAIREKEAGRVKRVVVAGCLVQRHRAKMLEWAPGIDAMVGVFDRDRIVEAVRGPAGGKGRSLPGTEAPRYWIAANALSAAKDRGMATASLTVNGKDGRGIGYWEDDSARVRLTPRHYAYLRVSEGCNQNCAFCTIPSIRGKMRSKPLEAVEREARELLHDGAFELLLIGQDTTSYGEDIGAGVRPDGSGGLPALLRGVSRAVEETTGRAWVRLMYAYPSNFSGAMIGALAEVSAGVADGSPRAGHVVPYIDIPLQHASDRMLGSMRRNVSASRQRDLIRELRERIPGMAVRTTLIAGFPGETEEDHQEVVRFVKEMRFEALGVFEYSREAGTPAGRMEGDASLAVPAEVKARRREEIMLAQQEVAFARAASRVGQRLNVLIDTPLRSTGRATAGVGKGGGLYSGRAYFQAPQVDAVTFVQARERLSPGELVACEVTGSDGYDLVARPVDDAEKRTRLRVVK